MIKITTLTSVIPLRQVNF